MPLLYLAQSIEGHVTRRGLQEVADLLGLTTAEVEAVASFYTMLGSVRPARTSCPCARTCRARSAGAQVYEAAHHAAGIPHGEDLSDDGIITLHEEECLGACEKAPVVQIDFVYHDDVTPDRMRELIRMLQAGDVPAPSRGEPMQDFRAASRLFAGLEPQQEADA